ncbi:MAG TPA: hypothetical protein VLM37_06755 [Fibrobacteraceae bacterium]|nr:hypothetical protein [Fibrobacteraceae bacterium]
MHSQLIQQFESEFSQGELDEVARCALPFFHTHWSDLRAFVERFRPLLGEDNLDTIIKLFILHYNMPFDMALYMKSQKTFIERTVRTTGEGMSPEARREAVAQWIRDNAQKHRREAILKQVLCFDKVKDRILPFVRQALKKDDPSSLSRPGKPT